jgi:hypothetical protein
MKTLAHIVVMIGAAALFAGCGGSLPPGATSPSGAAPFVFTHHKTFSYTGKKQTFKVPNGVTRIHVIAVGASGGGKVIADGGRVSAVIPVSPSETLAVYIGGAGTSTAGGFNGGGAGGQTTTVSGDDSYGGYGAGGASDVREGGDALKDRVVVAGGAGGQGGALTGDYKFGGRGGQGGALTGSSGKAGCCKHYGGDGGTGGTQSQGGSGGNGFNPGKSGQPGYGGGGGSGCDRPSCAYPSGGGGGGGGGFYGGGGGGGSAFSGSQGSSGGGGGGGGSSYVESTASKVHLSRGSKEAAGNGLVVVSW